MDRETLTDASNLLVEAAAKLSLAVHLLENEPGCAQLSQRVNSARYSADVALTAVRDALRRAGRT